MGRVDDSAHVCACRVGVRGRDDAPATPVAGLGFAWNKVVITLVVSRQIDNYSYRMIELIRSGTFDTWLSSLRDRRAVARIAARLDRLAAGNPGDVEPVGDGVSELRINYGPGYRVYFIQRGPVLVILLCGGDKSTQSKDIKQAKVLAAEWKG